MHDPNYTSPLWLFEIEHDTSTIPASWQDYEKFRRFGDSLLQKSAKLTELVQDLEGKLETLGDRFPEARKRVESSYPYCIRMCGFHFVPSKLSNSSILHRPSSSTL